MFQFWRTDILKVNYHVSQGLSLCKSLPLRKVEWGLHGLGKRRNKVQGSLWSQVSVPEPAPGFGTEKGWWGSGMAGAFSVLARAGSPVGGVCTGCLCGIRESSASAHYGQENIQELTPALCMADCFLSFRFGLNVTPQRGLPSAPHPAATLPCVSHHPV